MAEDARAEKRWEQATIWPLIAASVAFLIGYSWLILQPDMPRLQYLVILLVLGLVWVSFAVDYLVRLTLSPKKWAFVRANLIDLASVLIPLARPFRLIADLRRVPGLNGNSGKHLRRRVVIIAAAFVVMFIYVIALSVYSVERTAPHGNITSFGDAIWWACVTMATVGYGDYYPVTVPGRIFAVLLMMGGVAIVGTASATIVSYLNDRTRHLREERAEQHDEHDRSST